MKTWKIRLISLTQNKICLNVSKSVVVLFKSKQKTKKNNKQTKKQLLVTWNIITKKIILISEVPRRKSWWEFKLEATY